LRLIASGGQARRLNEIEDAAVDIVKLIVGIALAGLLGFIAVYFALGQRQTLAQLRHDVELSADDRRYLWRQVVRRLLNSVLLFLLAGFIVGWFFLESRFVPAEPVEPGAPVPESVKDSVWLLAYYVIAGLLVLLVVMTLTVADWVATARYGARRWRQLEDDRRAVLEAEVERLRRDRHGLNGGYKPG
jgi:hypothetical protein